MRPRPCSPRSGRRSWGSTGSNPGQLLRSRGDSVIGIQIVARATARGLAFSPEQLFEHQTIAELAAGMSAAQASETAAPPPAEIAFPPLDGGDLADGLPDSELDKIFSQLKGLP